MINLYIIGVVLFTFTSPLAIPATRPSHSSSVILSKFHPSYIAITGAKCVRYLNHFFNPLSLNFLLYTLNNSSRHALMLCVRAHTLHTKSSPLLNSYPLNTILSRDSEI